MFNLDFSGLFGGGGFALDTSKFNFDAYKAPEAKKEAVVDPVDVVSDKSPTPDVEVLEGAGTVAVTKPDPITQAIEALKGKDLSNDFNVNPIASAPIAPTPVATQPVAPVIPTPVAPTPVVKQPPKTPVAPTVVPIKEEIGNVISDGVKALAPDPIEQAIQTVKPLAMPSLGGAMDFSGLDLSQPETTPEKPQENNVTYDPIEAAMLNEDEEKDYYQSILSSSAPELEFSAINPSASKDETGRPQINSDILDYFIGQEQARAGLQDLRPAAQGEEDNEREEIEAANLGQDLVDKYNIPTSFNIDENYHWVLNPETMSYTKQLKSATNADVALMIGSTIASAGLGTAISGSSAVTSLSAGNAAVANAIGQGVANGITSAVQGGDTKDILLQTTIGAIQGGAEGLNEMTATARDAATVIGASQEAIKTATTLGAQAEIMNYVVNGIDLVQAVDEKDPLKAIESALLLTDNESLSTLVKDSVVGNVNSDFVINNSDVIASSIIGAGEAIIKGEDAKGVVTNAANTVIKENVLTTENVTKFLTENTDSEGFIADNMDSIVKGIVKGGTEALEGGNKEDIAIETVKPIVKETIKDFVKDIGSGDSSFDGLDFIEDAYHEHIEDPLEQFWQDIEPLREVVEETVGAGVDYVKAEVVQPVLDTVDTIIKEVEPTVDKIKEGASQANQFVQREVIDEIEVKLSNLNKDFQAEIAPIKEQFSELNRNVRQDLADFDEQVLQPYVTDQLSIANEQIRQELANFDSEELQPIKKDIEKVISTVDEKLSNFNKDYIKPIDQYLSDANAEFRDRLSDFEDSHLSPIKEELSAANEAFQGEVDVIQEALSQTNKDFREELSGFEDKYIDPLKKDLSETNKQVREDLANFDKNTLQPIKEDVEGLASDIKNGLSDANQYVRDSLADFDDSVLQPIKNDLESLIEGLGSDMGGMGDMLSNLWDMVNGIGDGLAATQERVGRPSADKSPLVKMRTQFGEQYEFEDLRNNPLLNNEFLS